VTKPSVSGIKQVFYIKLGEGGAWEQLCIQDGTIRLGFYEVPSAIAQSRDTEAIRRIYLDRGVDGGTATRYAGEATLDYTLKHQDTIPAYDLVRACAQKITVGMNLLTIRVSPKGFQKLAETYLNIKPGCCDEIFDIAVPFKIGKAKRGAIIIKPAGRDMFDMPPDQLKKLVQGVIWRDEHFGGMTLTEIARRAGCSDAYVGKCIITSFDTLIPT
jgi:hypothetical protein